MAAHVIEGEFNVSLLEFREWLAWLEHDRALIAGCGPWLRAGADSESRRRKVSQPDQTLACHDGGSLQHVAQFPHITGPIIAMKQIHHFGIHPGYARRVFLVQVSQHALRSEERRVGKERR